MYIHGVNLTMLLLNLHIVDNFLWHRTPSSLVGGASTLVNGPTN